jgi:hypothetical protein
MGLDDLGQAAESHAGDGPIESSARQVRDGIGRGELLVEGLRRVDRLSQRNQPVHQRAIADELAALAAECIGVDLVECPDQVTVADVYPGAREREGRCHEAEQHVTDSLRPAVTVVRRPRERVRGVLAQLCRVGHAVELVLYDDLRARAYGVDHDVEVAAFSPDAYLADAVVVRGAEKAEQRRARDREVPQQPRDRVGVEQFLPRPGLCPQQVVLEGIQEGNNPLQQTRFDGSVRKLPRPRRRDRGGWIRCNHCIFGKRVERQVAHRVG